MRRLDIKGKRFGRLVSQEYFSKNNSGQRWVWQCLCDCGNIAYVRTGSLICGTTRSCGCLRDELTSNLTKKRPFEHLYNTFKSTCGKPVEISFDEFLSLVKIKECHYCGIPILWPEHQSSKVTRCNAYYLDRKDTLKGYTMDNVAVCCTRCNIGKSRFFSYEEWVEIGKCIKAMRSQKTVEVFHATYA